MAALTRIPQGMEVLQKVVAVACIRQPAHFAAPPQSSYHTQQYPRVVPVHNHSHVSPQTLTIPWLVDLSPWERWGAGSRAPNQASVLNSRCHNCSLDHRSTVTRPTAVSKNGIPLAHIPCSGGTTATDSPGRLRLRPKHHVTKHGEAMRRGTTVDHGGGWLPDRRCLAAAALPEVGCARNVL